MFADNFDVTHAIPLRITNFLFHQTIKSGFPNPPWTLFRSLGTQTLGGSMRVHIPFNFLHCAPNWTKTMVIKSSLSSHCQIKKPRTPLCGAENRFQNNLFELLATNVFCRVQAAAGSSQLVRASCWLSNCQKKMIYLHMNFSTRIHELLVQIHCFSRFTLKYN